MKKIKAIKQWARPVLMVLTREADRPESVLQFCKKADAGWPGAGERFSSCQLQEWLPGWGPCLACSQESAS